MTLRLYNTLTKTKQDFAPLDPANVRMYVCGPTVYDFAHIGNARPAIVFDVLFRLLRHTYGEAHVTYVRNITDVDDKINARAAERGISIRDLTDETYAQYKDDVTALGCLPPSEEPRATDYIEQMKELIEKLAENQHAYVADDHVIFHVPSMPDYGQLSKRSLDEMIAGARVDVAPYKRNPMDFVLWKPSDQRSNVAMPAWPSPGGIETPGRPGWHIECSAMSWVKLGQIFDIHGGGLDLIFPHHENEIAQSRCAFHTGLMAKYWMHNGFLQVEGEKMSKSRGNFITIRQNLTNWHNSSWPGDSIRFNMLRTHYRQPIDWTLAALEESHKILWEYQSAFDLTGISLQQGAEVDVPAPVIDALSDDLNTPKAITELHGLKRKGDIVGLWAAMRFLGFTCASGKLVRSVATSAAFTGGGSFNPVSVASIRTLYGEVLESEIEASIAARNAARKAKNFAESDRIRDELLAKGIVLKDSPSGTTWEVKR